MRNRILKSISDYLGIEDVNPDQYFYDDLNLEPLDFADLILKIEQEYKITIPKEEISKILKVEDLVKIIEDNDPDFN
jgi:acyl carrier protein